MQTNIHTHKCGKSESNVSRYEFSQFSLTMIKVVVGCDANANCNITPNGDECRTKCASSLCTIARFYSENARNVDDKRISIVCTATQFYVYERKGAIDEAIK